ncbi:MAG: hypothetical protein H8E48_08135 [Chloroflexi bacterium]|nr:hypothetical protein [Chloroflexota bacterium]
MSTSSISRDNDFDNIRLPKNLDHYLELIAAVIRSGLEKEGPGYVLTPGGRYWCLLGDLDPGFLSKKAARRTLNGRKHPKDAPARGGKGLTGRAEDIAGIEEGVRAGRSGAHGYAEGN